MQMKNYINIRPQYVHNLSYFQSICSKWLPSILSQNTALSKIALRTRRKICGLIVRQARTRRSTPKT